MSRAGFCSGLEENLDHRIPSASLDTGYSPLGPAAYTRAVRWALGRIALDGAAFIHHSSFDDKSAYHPSDLMLEDGQSEQG